MSAPRFVVTLWDIDAATRGRNSVKAVISDARDVGVSAYANEGGEMFFTLPYNHPQVAECQPWLRHYEVRRLNSSGTYDVVGVGLLDDFDATPEEVIVYGRDYLSLFDRSISGANTSYTSIDIGTIIQTELSAAINLLPSSGVSVAKHITLGTIESTGQTVTVLTSYQPRLQLCRQLVDIWQSDSSVRPIIAVSRSSPFTVSFQKNAGTNNNAYRLAYGGLINDFRYVPGFTDFATRVYAVGQKREGASLLFATADYASAALYGVIQVPRLFIDVVDQAALNRKTQRAARTVGTVGKNLAIGLRLNQIGPWEWGSLGDSLPISISRGIVSLSGLYTVWGQEWIGKADGSEDMFLSILPQET